MEGIEIYKNHYYAHTDSIPTHAILCHLSDPWVNPETGPSDKWEGNSQINRNNIVICCALSSIAFWTVRDIFIFARCNCLLTPHQ